MKTRILAVMLVICMLLTLTPAVFAEESAITWTVVDGVMTISGTGTMCPEDEPLPYEWPDGEGITAIVVEEGITDVDDFAFEDFTELTTVTLADSVETVGYSAFAGCSALTDVTMAYGIHVNKDAFTDTPWLAALPRDEKGFAVYQGIVLHYAGEETDIEIPEGVVSIAGDFSETELSSVWLPESVVTVGDYAFCNQYNLAQINFPAGLKRIGDWAFEDTAVTTAMLPEGLEYLGDGAFYNCRQLTDASVPGGLSYLGDSVFLQCITLTNVTLGEGIDGIPEDMFRWCRSLAAVELPSTITYIGKEAFSSCYSLTEIVIPEGVTSIGYYAFGGCYWMTSAVLPETLELLDDSAFSGCIRLTRFNIPDSVQYLSCRGLEDTPWLEEQYDENGFAIIGRWLLSYRGSDTSLVIPDSVERIASYALNVCESKDSITSLTLPEGLEYIGSGAFEYCSGLTELTIPDTVTFIDGAAFYHCTGLTELVIPDSIATLGGYAFDGCSGLTNVTLSANLTVIPDACFYGCTSLKSIEIPDGITTICYEAFYGCTSMDSITIPASVTVIEHEALGYYFDDYWYTSEPIRYFTIYGYTGSAAEAYANENDIDFVALDTPVEPPVEEPRFTDVPADSFYAEPVAWAVENGITSGATDTTFNPDGACLRAQVVTFLWRAMGCPTPERSDNPFVDVMESDFYYEAVLWAVENNITTGSDATHFNPYGVCNRAQVVTFLYRAFGDSDVSADGLPFTDVPTNSFYAKPVAWAVAYGITNGISATEFGPNSPCNRAQVVTFLYRVFN